MSDKFAHKFFPRLLPAILFIALAYSSPAFSQYSSQTLVTDTGTIVACYHASGKISTAEFWDNEKRWGRMTGFDSEGKELFDYFLRSFAGHASVNLSYYPNGQVKKAEYRSAPDGGIQFYHIIHHFDEAGIQTAYVDLSQPDGRPVVLNPNEVKYPSPDQNPKIEKPVATEAMSCATPCMSVFSITNETTRKITVNLIPVQNFWKIMPPHYNLVIPPKTSMAVDSVILAERYFTHNEAYKMEVLQNRKNRIPIKIINGISSQTGTRKEITWHLIRK
jgi:hypothetical protein